MMGVGGFELGVAPGTLMEVYWCQTCTSRVSAELKVLEQHALSGCFELKGRCGSCSLHGFSASSGLLERQTKERRTLRPVGPAAGGSGSCKCGYLIICRICCRELPAPAGERLLCRDFSNKGLL